MKFRVIGYCRGKPDNLSGINRAVFEVRTESLCGNTKYICKKIENMFMDIWDVKSVDVDIIYDSGDDIASM